MAAHCHCRRHILFCKIQLRPRSCRSYLLWRPCISWLCLLETAYASLVSNKFYISIYYFSDLRYQTLNFCWWSFAHWRSICRHQIWGCQRCWKPFFSPIGQQWFVSICWCTRWLFHLAKEFGQGLGQPTSSQCWQNPARGFAHCLQIWRGKKNKIIETSIILLIVDLCLQGVHWNLFELTLA